MPIYDMFNIFGNILGSIFRNCKQHFKFAKIRAFCAKTVYIVKNVRKKCCAKYDKLCISRKPLTIFKNAKICASLSQTWCLIKKNCKYTNPLQRHVCKISLQAFCIPLSFFNSFRKSYNKSKSKNRKWV